MTVPISLNRTILEQIEREGDAGITLVSSTQHLTRMQIALRLHKQFAHPPADRLLKALSNSEYGQDEELKMKLTQVSENCALCKKYNRPSRSPVAVMSIADRFNQTLAMDIKFIKGKPVLYMIDALTKCSSTSVLSSKSTDGILDAVVKHWINVYGPPSTIISCDRGEFGTEKFRAMGETFNIKIITTDAESSWANGICESYNDVLGKMVEKILEEVDCNLSVAVAWATAAKNGLQNIHGFSPAQLVFGFNPVLPCVNGDKPPVLSEDSYSEIIEDNLQAKKKAREAFIRTESSSRIRRALSHNIRSSEDIKYLTGDKVYYKRATDKRWCGPGTVTGQDGQFVLIHTLASWVRAHPCRLRLITGEEEQYSTIHIQQEVDITIPNNDNSELQTDMETMDPIVASGGNIDENQDKENNVADERGENEDENQINEENVQVNIGAIHNGKDPYNKAKRGRSQSHKTQFYPVFIQFLDFIQFLPSSCFYPMMQILLQQLEYVAKLKKVCKQRKRGGMLM